MYIYLKSQVDFRRYFSKYFITVVKHGIYYKCRYSYKITGISIIPKSNKDMAVT